MKTLSIKLQEKTTEIFIDNRISLLDLLPDVSNCLLVTDDTLFGTDVLSDIITSSGIKTAVIPSGEVHKNLAGIEKISEAAMNAGLDRDGLIIGVGGGVVCDMAAFAASIYMRGCSLHLVPTTLLAMVDASIGGKTGVDFRDRKNLIGSFYPAERVSIYTDFLNTLPEREFKSGLAEIIKHAFLTGDDFIDFMEKERAAVVSRDEVVMKDLVYRSLLVKADFVERDFKEAGCRAHLNFGHTFGHALETAAGLGRFSHGEAVAWGMNRAFRAGIALGLTDYLYAQRAEKLLRDYGYDLDFNDFDLVRYIDALSADKKKKDGLVRFILQSGPGETFITGIDADILDKVLSGR